MFHYISIKRTIGGVEIYMFFSLLRLHLNVNSSLDRLSKFIFTEWLFHSKKTEELQKWMSLKDQEVYDVTLNSLVWTDIFKMMIIGTRIYLNKEPLKNLEAARKKNQMYVFIRYYTHSFNQSNLLKEIKTLIFFQAEDLTLWRTDCGLHYYLDSVFIYFQYFSFAWRCYYSIDIHWPKLYLDFVRYHESLHVVYILSYFHLKFMGCCIRRIFQYDCIIIINMD